eukprot:8320-Heterococcus_DN1.PRE.3
MHRAVAAASRRSLLQTAADSSKTRLYDMAMHHHASCIAERLLCLLREHDIAQLTVRRHNQLLSMYVLLSASPSQSSRHKLALTYTL